MIISSIEIKGWRSYSDEDGIKLDDLKQFNLIIGPNNSGKSNLQKFFRKLVEVNKMMSYSGTLAEIMIENYTDNEDEGRGNLNEQDFWNNDNPKYDAIIHIRIVKAEGEDNPIKGVLFNQLGEFSIKASAFQDKNKPYWSQNIWQASIYPLLLLEKQLREVFLKSGAGFKWMKGQLPYNEIEFVGTEVENSIRPPAYENIRLFLKSFLFVDPIRHHSELKEENERAFDGSTVIDNLYRLSNDKDNRNEWKKIATSMKGWLREILREEVLNIFFVERELTFEVKRRNDPKDQFFTHLGTGVLQAILLLCYLYERKNDNLFVFLDEPENNLHTGATCRLVEILQREFSQHQFFICTHSPALMDMVDSNWTVFQTTFKPETGTTFTPCPTLISKHRVLDDLGIRASQILQSNFVIWVEGPSDRIYIRRWIELRSNGSLKEGMHFSFLFYGGAVLRHFGFADYSLDDLNEIKELADGDLISFFSTSRYAAIITDSDKADESQADKPMVKALENSLNADQGLSESILLWVTDGREIENYVPVRLWQMLDSEKAKGLKRTRAKDTNGNDIQLEFSLDNKFSVGRFDDFANRLAGAYRSKGGKVNEKRVIEKLKHFHDSQKVNLAEFFASAWEAGDFENSVGLNVKMDLLISKIRAANGLPQ